MRQTTLVITETQFQQQVIDLAHLTGWTVAHFRAAKVIIKGVETYRTPVQADGKGFPDLVLVKPPRVLFIELKSESGQASPEQVAWLLLLGKCPGIETYCWKPSQWDEIVEILRRERVNGQTK